MHQNLLTIIISYSQFMKEKFVVNISTLVKLFYKHIFGGVDMSDRVHLAYVYKKVCLVPLIQCHGPPFFNIVPFFFVTPTLTPQNYNQHISCHLGRGRGHRINKFADNRVKKLVITFRIFSVIWVDDALVISTLSINQEELLFITIVYLLSIFPHFLNVEHTFFCGISCIQCRRCSCLLKF